MLKNSSVREFICEAIKWELNKAPKDVKIQHQIIMSLCHCLMENSRILIFSTSNNYVITFEDSMLKKKSILEFPNILFIFLHKILFFEIFVLLKILTLLKII